MAAARTPSQTKPTQSERTFQMLKNFLQHHNDGLSIKEIAYRYDLDTSTVYRYLGQIAEQYNATHPDTPITRESLLERPHSPHTPHNYVYEPLTPVDLTGFRQEVDSVMRSIDGLLANIASNILGQELLDLKHI